MFQVYVPPENTNKFIITYTVIFTDCVVVRVVVANCIRNFLIIVNLAIYIAIKKGRLKSFPGIWF